MLGLTHSHYMIIVRNINYADMFTSPPMNLHSAINNHSMQIHCNVNLCAKLMMFAK